MRDTMTDVGLFTASVIIPSYNCAAALERTLLALAEQTLPRDAFEVIVVDDGSADRTLERLQGRAEVGAGSPRPYALRVLAQQNRGPAVARNLGARNARAGLLVFLDADMIPVAPWLMTFVEAHESQPDAILMGRIRPLPEAFQTLMDHTARLEEARDLGASPRPLEFYHIVSCNMALGAPVFRSLGGFDETLRMAEDTDLGYRSLMAAIPLCYCPEALALHNHPRSLDDRCRNIRASAFWTAHLLRKHRAMTPLLPIYQDILPIAWGRDPAALILRKLARRGLALSLSRKMMALSIRALEKWWPAPALLRSLYYKLMGGYRFEGLREGRRKSA